MFYELRQLFDTMQNWNVLMGLFTDSLAFFNAVGVEDQMKISLIKTIGI